MKSQRHQTIKSIIEGGSVSTQGQLRAALTEAGFTVNQATLSRDMRELGIVKREFSVSDGIKKKANTNRGLYRLTDNFFRFWYAFVFTNFSELESGDAAGVYKYSIEPSLHEFAASTFEDICREYVQLLQKENALPFRYSQIGRWWGKTTVRRKDNSEIGETEIDILATSKNADKYLVGECKFKKQPFRYSEYLDVKAKLLPQQEKAEFFYYLFSESGFDDKIIAEARSSPNITLCNLSDIISGKALS